MKKGWQALWGVEEGRAVAADWAQSLICFVGNYHTTSP